MIKTIDTFKTEKEINSLKNELMKTLNKFQEEAKEWSNKNKYYGSKYILVPTAEIPKEKPYIIKYTLEVKQLVKED